LKRTIALLVVLFVVGLVPNSSFGIVDGGVGRPADAPVYQLPLQLDPSSPRYRDQLEVQRQIAFRLKIERKLEKVEAQLAQAQRDLDKARESGNVWCIGEVNGLANELSVVKTQFTEFRQEFTECHEAEMQDLRYKYKEMIVSMAQAFAGVPVTSDDPRAQPATPH